jgi:hypothetical protein
VTDLSKNPFFEFEKFVVDDKYIIGQTRVEGVLVDTLHIPYEFDQSKYQMKIIASKDFIDDFIFLLNHRLKLN